MFKKILILIAFVASFASAKAVVNSPTSVCISVLPNGNITITWVPPTDLLNEFVSYSIYRSTTVFTGPYTLVTTLGTLSQTSYTDITANGNAGPVYYYVQTTYNAGGNITSPPADTITSMFLIVANPGNGTAVLTWNPIFNPALATTSHIYHIFEEYPTGTWTQIGTTAVTTPTSTFTAIIYPCGLHQINFRVTIADTVAGCTSTSSATGGNFQNTIAPAFPIVDTLSVDNANHAILSWNVNTAADFQGYIIYRFNGGWIAIDTVFGVNNTSYTYLLSTAGAGAEQYCMAAYDSCGNISPLGISPLTQNHTSIFLTTSPVICDHSATLSWTNYLNIGTGLAGFRIYQSAVSPAGPYAYLGSVPAGTLTYSAGGLTTGTTYYFKVEAYDNSGAKTVSSNRKSFYCSSPIPPNFLYLVSASVASANRVDVTAFVDTAASVLGYKVLRSTVNSAPSFTQIGTIPTSTTPLVMFSDYSADTDNNSYYYKVVNIDSCGFDGMQSNVGRTVHVTVQGNTDFTNTFTWNKYENWGGRVTAYRIYRGLDGILDPLPIIVTDSIQGVDTTITDDVWSVLTGDGNFYYEVEAVEGGTNISGINAISKSNIAVAKQPSEVFVPNAFTPDAGVNTVFKPVGRWTDYSNFELLIFDRFGQNIFSTTKFDEGWDGTRSGNICETGVYVYSLKYKNAKGESFQTRGMVTLVR